MRNPSHYIKLVLSILIPLTLLSVGIDLVSGESAPNPDSPPYAPDRLIVPKSDRERLQ